MLSHPDATTFIAETAEHAKILGHRDTEARRHGGTEEVVQHVNFGCRSASAV
jgi:hypothetical protein